MSNLQYLSGFGNQHKSEALEGALPEYQNTPQKCPYGLYAEQLQGTSFTAFPREKNQRSWTYRIRPSASYPEYKRMENTKARIQSSFPTNEYTDPTRYRWMPIDIPTDRVDFVDGLVTVAGAGNAAVKAGFAVHLYAISDDMYNEKKRRVTLNADGDYLIVPEEGSLYIITEFGHLQVDQKEIVVIPRGIRFAINPLHGKARGYICELFQGHFELPYLGPIGANGLANPRDFLYPTARYEDSNEPVELVHKMQGKYFTTEAYTPFDIVAWHGNYAPYKYDLRKFAAVNTVTFDHMDPSIFTVLTAPSHDLGTAVIDFVIFPPRWGVAENTFRPPYYHRNTMSEYMGLITGNYEAKLSMTKQGGFVPGGGSLHNCMTGHGPETKVFEKESNKELVPEEVGKGSLAFMFESVFHFNVTKYGATEIPRDENYVDCWKDVKKYFNPNEKNPSIQS